MRILLLNYEFPPLGGGAGNASFYLLEEFAHTDNLTIDVVTSSGGAFSKEKFAKNITIYRLNIYKRGDIHHQTVLNLLTYAWKAFWFARRLKKQYRYSGIHAFFGIPCGLIARLLRLPYIVSLRGSDVPFYNPRFYWLDRFVFQYISRRVWARACAVTTNSHDLEQLARQIAPRQQMQIIWNGVDTSQFFPRGVFHNTRTIISTSRLIQRKGIGYVIDAMRLLRQSGQQFRLLLVGGGDLQEHYQTVVASEGLQDCMRFFGSIPHEQLPDLYRQANVFVSASLNEGMSNSLLEAMASGLAIITTPTGSAKELVNAENGMVVPPRNSKAIADAIIELFSSDTELQRRQHASRVRAQGVRWAQTATKTRGLYDTHFAPSTAIERVVMIAPTPFFSHRGTHIRILEEATALVRRGHRVTIVTYHIGDDLPIAMSGIRIERIRRFLFWYKKREAGPDWQKIILDLLLIPKVVSVALREKATILHAHLHEGAAIGIFAQKIIFWRRIRLVVDFHGSLTEEMISHSYLRNPASRRLFRFLEKRINALGDAAIASSPENQEEIARYRPTLIAMIGDGVHHTALQENIFEGQARVQFHLPLNKTIICYTGSLIANKGIIYVLDAAKALQAFADSLHFVLAGFPVDVVEGFVREHHLRNVTVISPLSYFDLPLLLRACDIAIDPKDDRTRQASGKILQYMGAGLPIVCFDRLSNRRYVPDGAFFCSRISGAGLVEGVMYYVQHPETTQEHGARNRIRARQYSWETVAQKIEQVYASV